ncbi:sulfotransferase family 2 domain-containing protein [Heliomarina baculiformis]|uniref:sulfotransferase family 2 domain-containing protein n=1 Tax=Heliomarina baculiformis TaxID=2872036 RepID=UPI001EE26835|nr:sulfotransferase family 2 domain-containing protein [Heliomarina baculiformis]
MIDITADPASLDANRVLDTRTSLNRNGLSRLQNGLDKFMGLGRNHFCLDVNRKKIGYCYIRKNGCSSFKKMFLEQSPHGYDPASQKRPIDFIRMNHLMEDSDFATCDHVVLVYRDPVKRMLSLFRNKFILCSGADDLFANYERVTGTAPLDASFRSFVMDYLHQPWAALDRHALPQRYHLRRAVYTDVMPVEKIYNRMIGVVGQSMADKYFRRPVNRTSDVERVEMEGADVMPVEALREHYAQRHVLPDDASLLGENLSEVLKDRYQMDFEFIARFETQSVQ